MDALEAWSQKTRLLGGLKTQIHVYPPFLWNDGNNSKKPLAELGLHYAMINDKVQKVNSMKRLK